MNDEGEGEDVDGGQPDALVRGPHSRCDMSLVPTPLATTQAQTPKPTSSRRVLTLTLTGTPSPGPTPLTPTTNPDPNPQPQPLTPTLTLSLSLTPTPKPNPNPNPNPTQAAAFPTYMATVVALELGSSSLKAYVENSRPETSANSTSGLVPHAPLAPDQA